MIPAIKRSSQLLLPLRLQSSHHLFHSVQHAVADPAPATPVTLECKPLASRPSWLPASCGWWFAQSLLHLSPKAILPSRPISKHYFSAQPNRPYRWVVWDPHWTYKWICFPSHSIMAWDMPEMCPAKPHLSIGLVFMFLPRSTWCSWLSHDTIFFFRSRFHLWFNVFSYH